MNLSDRKTSRPPHEFDFEGAVLRTLDFTGINLTSANLKRVDARKTIFARVNFLHADLSGADLRGADLTGAKNTTMDQLQSAVVDETTRLPDYIDPARLTRAAAE
ncbi:pentapeptide repeat-containing protein [Aurantimonas sp. VKM B-3413]|uniref:pentapeptide repeat-containing protein n=1 Tax=Aurantimonas sp. VKM B-3413 TaxID=2779401 RepID=UPI001E546BC5|nr:pentapeptide repeat-containing protein [Aurantimonas sp. VKM B-3413]MCB8840603.1 pentapeptide repeat-containing protein [Aurantimonas sp. VKM B-3413]